MLAYAAKLRQEKRQNTRLSKADVERIKAIKKGALPALETLANSSRGVQRQRGRQPSEGGQQPSAVQEETKDFTEKVGCQLLLLSLPGSLICCSCGFFVHMCHRPCRPSVPALASKNKHSLTQCATCISFTGAEEVQAGNLTGRPGTLDAVGCAQGCLGRTLDAGGGAGGPAGAVQCHHGHALAIRATASCLSIELIWGSVKHFHFVVHVIAAGLASLRCLVGHCRATCNAHNQHMSCFLPCNHCSSP